jgi:prostaglandin-H2 D-isomerase / glutathione transferase
MSSYKLYYFNGRGRAEVARLIFAAAGEQYDDIRYEQKDWPTHKTEMPLGQMPVLEYNGVKLPQSLTIARFLANQFNLAGKDNIERAQVDAVVDTISDALEKYVPIRWESDETKKQEMTKKFLADELPKHLSNIEALAKLYGKQGAFFVGNQMTWSDLFFYQVVQLLFELDSNCLSSYPLLTSNRQEVEKQPKIAEYLKNRPATPF